MEDELAALLRAQPYERTHLRLDIRNGVYHRRLVTELGAITDLAVPRRRLVPYRPSFLRAAARRTATVDEVLRRAFLRGLSTRETAALAETLTGVPLSAASVSRLAAQLDAQVAAFHRRPVTFAGALPARRRPVGVGPLRDPGHKRVVLAAYGIDADGRRELLDYRQAACGVGGRVGSSAHARSSRGASTPTRSSWSPPTGRAGSRRPSPRRSPRPPSSAAGPTGSGTSSRRCRWPSASLPARPARHVPGPDEAGRGARVLALGEGLARPPPGCSSPPRADLDALLAVFALPEPVRATLRTTNLIERAFRELRRRLRPIGWLTDRRSADRILYGQVLRLNELLARRPLAAFTQET